MRERRENEVEEEEGVLQHIFARIFFFVEKQTVQHISLSGQLWLTLLCKNHYLLLLVMSKEVHSHLFPLLCRHWVLKRPSPPALLMMRK